MERLLDELSFNATDSSGNDILVDEAYVNEQLGDLAQNADLSRFIL